MADRLWLSGWSVPAFVWEKTIQRLPPRQRTWDCNQGMGCPVPSAEQALLTLQPPVTVIGWSMGAMIALELALRHPQRIDRLVLIAATDRFIRDKEQKSGWDPRVLYQMKKQLHHHPSKVLTAFDQRLFFPDVPDDRWIREIRHRHIDSSERLVAGLEYLEQFHFSPDQAAQVTVPVHLLHGKQDTICHPDGAQRLSIRFPQGEWTLWEEVGHIPFWTHPHRFIRWLERRLL